jgi:hypothetical protein
MVQAERRNAVERRIVLEEIGRRRKIADER